MQVIADTMDLSGFMEAKVEHDIRPACDWVDSVVKALCEPPDAPGVQLGFAGTENIFEFRDGEVTVLAGPNGHGKSAFSSQVVLNLCVQNQRTCIASLEMAPERTMQRMVKQAHGTAYPDEKYIREMSAWTDEKLWLYAQTGSVTAKRMLAVIRYAIDKFGIKIFVVDNLTKCGIADDDLAGQKSFIDAVTAIAKDTDTHIIIIAHIRKSGSDYDLPSKNDIRGSAAITDLVDNVFLIYRNKRKEDIRNGKLRVKDEDYTRSQNEADTFVSIEKQRNGAWEDRIGFWYDIQSMQYMTSPDRMTQTYAVNNKSNLDDF
jgi:twinkle protein